MEGVSIITCTHMPYYRENILQNYARQRYFPKELLLILNNTSLNELEWRGYASRFNDVRVFVLPQEVTVGSCMNYAVSQARYDYIANFDHDDYYGAEYLNDFMKVAPRLDAGLFGKKSIYVHLEEDNTLALWCPGHENQYVDHFHGPTMFMKKSIFDKVNYIDNDFSDFRFCLDCADKGIKAYSVNKQHFAYIRKKDVGLHTWKKNNQEIVRDYCAFITKTPNYRQYVDRK